jgi:cytoskeleton protein RodZ
MPTVGELLRAAREQAGLTISQAADQTNLKGDHIRALEEGDYGVFAAPVYAKGSMRTYAKLLKLDPVAVVQQMSAELDEVEKFRDAVGQGGKPGFLDRLLFHLSRIHWRVAVILLVLSGAVYGGVYAYQRWQEQKAGGASSELPTAVYSAPVQPGETLPLPKAPAKGGPLAKQ